jgi:hypothetical protein
MLRTYEVRSGRRAVAVEVASTPHEALTTFLLKCGSQAAEIVRLGVDKAAWRGAIFCAVDTDQD